MLRNTRKFIETEIANLNGRLSILENSRSWNLTRPLRSIARASSVDDTLIECCEWSPTSEKGLYSK